ncbi:hypothetical protein [Kitasatospora sp. GAS204B]|uniref:hypothetical protein n=1 Tax=unclassified Kitasatospora TaxID=2633591 RepID=UPI002475EE48|nr:hypothetical protein [Kitasatospora sp. GAS204B]
MDTFLLGCAVVGVIAHGTRVAKSERRAAQSAAEAAAALAEIKAIRAAAVVSLTKAPLPGRQQQLAVLHSELVQVLGRRAASELRAAPVDAVPQDVVPAPAPSGGDGLARLTPAGGPRDSAGPVPQRQADERFHYSGVLTAASEEEYPIEWPEPGAVAIAEVAAEAKQLTIVPMTRTRTRVHTHSKLAYVFDYEGQVRTRGVLTPDMTHLKVQSEKGGATWSVRLLAPSELDELVDERRGTGSPILAVRPQTPVEVVVHAKSSSSWSIEFVCGCWAGDECACTTGRELGYVARTVSASYEAIEVLTVLRPGLLVVKMHEDTDPWHLRIRDVNSELYED